MSKVVVMAGPVDGLFEEIEMALVSKRLEGARFPGVRCKACGRVFLCSEPARMPSQRYPVARIPDPSAAPSVRQGGVSHCHFRPAAAGSDQPTGAITG